MGVLDKIKRALFEEVEEDEELEKEDKKQQKSDTIVKKIDVPKTTTLKREEKEKKSINQVVEEEKKEDIKRFKKEEKPRGPIIFDDEDFISDTKEIKFKEVPKKEDKILYGGEKREEVKKQNFKPSPIISPVYGIIKTTTTTTTTTTSVVKEKTIESPKKSLDYLFAKEEPNSITFDTIRQKAFGKETEDKSLLYEMQELDEKPGIEKVTVGDAVEYFEDLGLEYNVDYKDSAKENLTRRKKNKELTETVEKENKRSKALDKNIKKEKDETPDEKNLYDLIDMMYDNKE